MILADFLTGDNSQQSRSQGEPQGYPRRGHDDSRRRARGDPVLPRAEVLPWTHASLRRVAAATHRIAGAVPRERVWRIRSGALPLADESSRVWHAAVGDPQCGRARVRLDGAAQRVGYTHRSRMTPWRGGPSQQGMPCGASARLAGRSGLRRPCQAVTACPCDTFEFIPIKSSVARGVRRTRRVMQGATDLYHRSRTPCFHRRMRSFTMQQRLTLLFTCSMPEPAVVQRLIGLFLLPCQLLARGFWSA